MFGSPIVFTDNKCTFHFISIENYSTDLIEYIATEVGKIWNGDLDIVDELDIIKSELKDLFKGKSELQQHGLVSEFICHLYLRNVGYEQYFLFRNLEEKGMKKGFDGLYILDDEYWIYESKSTLPGTKVASHNGNISEAYNDLKKKIEGKNHTNNPWKNAYSHIMNRAIKENATLSQTLRAFSTDYTKEKYHSITKFRVIPSSTIYMGDLWSNINSEELKPKLQTLVDKYTCSKINVLCLNKKTINNFIQFING